MKTIYRSEKGKKEILDLYDAQLARLGRPYKDIYVETSFGKTHLIETGNLQGEPLLVFHGGNEDIPMKTHVDACTKDKYWWMVILYVLFFMMGQLVKNTSMSFYARWMFDSVLSAADPESASGAMMRRQGIGTGTQREGISTGGGTA